MLLTACNYYQLQSTSRHVQKCSTFQNKMWIRMQVKHLLNVNSLEIIWSSFLLIVMNTLLSKPALIRKSLFQLFWHWFLTLSFFLSFFHRKLDIQICFCKIGGKNGKKLLTETFLDYQKGVFTIFQFSRSVHLCRKWFSGEKKERKTTLFQATQADQIS